MDQMDLKGIYPLSIIVFVAGCATLAANQLDQRYGKTQPRERVVEELPPQTVDYWSTVKPIVEKRCVVCHACYDAQCQLKMSSIEGIERGATSAKVYNGARIKPAQMTRLFEDAQSTAHWREMISNPAGRISRPRQLYTGPPERDYTGIDNR